MCCRREDSEMARAIYLSLAESDKSSNKNSRQNDTSDTHEPPNLSTTIDPPPGLKKKRSSNLNEPQESNLLTSVPEPPPGFKKKQSTCITEKDFPVMIKVPESLPSAPSLSYGKLIGSNVNKQEFPTLHGNPTADNRPVAPPPGFGKKTPSSATVKPQLEKKESFVKQLRLVLKSDENFEQFKIWSSQYRMSEISAEEYDNNCYKLFGDQQWDNIFDELAATFPDKQGRDDLIKVHHDHGTKIPKKSKAKKHHHDNNDRPLTAWGIGNNRLGDHMNEDLYPPLSSTSMVQPPPAKWGHKVAVK